MLCGWGDGGTGGRCACRGVSASPRRLYPVADRWGSLCVEAFSSSLSSCVCGRQSCGTLDIHAALASALFFTYPFLGTAGAHRVAGGGGGS